MTDVDYAPAREQLLRAEVDLMVRREEVAAMRRALPPGPFVDDYVFEEAALRSDGGVETGEVRLSELFSGRDRTLILYHFMLGKRQTQACPMCSMWADGWAGVASHLAERVDFALVSGGPATELAALAVERDWEGLRLLGAAGSTFKRDIGGEDEAGHQEPFLSVYRLDDGRPRLRYSVGAHLRDEHWRGVDLLSPVWHLLDLTPEGRGDWMPGG